MGGIFTGQGTDPNLGLLLALFAFCLISFKVQRPEATVDNTVNLEATGQRGLAGKISFKNAN